MSSTLQILVDVAVKGKDQLRGVSSELENINGAIKGAEDTWKKYTMAIAKVTGGLAAVAIAGKKAYDFFKEGAEIEFTAKKFDNLAASINTTGDALLGSLKNATRGMVSDLELMASASELVSLGLTKTEDETVRLASVSGQLGWNMQQVVLTLANMSTMRLDALGLSVEEVTSRAKELEAAGMAAQEAFKMAVIEAGEAKLEILGVEGGSALEEIKQLEASWSNFVTSAKTAVLNVVVSGGGLNILEGLTNMFNGGTETRAFMRQLANMVEAGMMTASEMQGYLNIAGSAGGQSLWDAQAMVGRRMMDPRIANDMDEYIRGLAEVQAAESDLAAQRERSAAMAANFFEATSGTRQRGTSWKPIDVESLQRSDEQLAAIQERLEAMQATADRRAAGGAAFDFGLSDPLQLTAAADFNQLLYDRALAAGAGAMALANLGLATGQLTEAQVENARVSMEFDRQLAALATRMANESISYEEYIAMAQEINQLAQEGSLGGLIQAAVGTGYGTVAPETQAMKEYMQEWRAMEGLEVSPTIDVQGGTGEVNTIRDTLMEIDKINAAPSVSIGGSWASDINAIRAAMAELEAWSPGAPATPAAPSSSGGGGNGAQVASAGGNTHNVTYIENYNVRSSGGGDAQLVALEAIGI